MSRLYLQSARPLRVERRPRAAKAPSSRSSPRTGSESASSPGAKLLTASVAGGAPDRRRRRVLPDVRRDLGRGRHDRVRADPRCPASSAFPLREAKPQVLTDPDGASRGYAHVFPQFLSGRPHPPLHGLGRPRTRSSAGSGAAVPSDPRPGAAWRRQSGRRPTPPPVTSSCPGPRVSRRRPSTPTARGPRAPRLPSSTTCSRRRTSADSPGSRCRTRERSSMFPETRPWGRWPGSIGTARSRRSRDEPERLVDLVPVP